MTLALTKISCVNDRLIPLGLACLQAYLKQQDITFDIFNFRSDTYSLPKIALDLLIQLKPHRFVMNHQYFSILVKIFSKFLSI